MLGPVPGEIVGEGVGVRGGEIESTGDEEHAVAEGFGVESATVNRQ